HDMNLLVSTKNNTFSKIHMRRLHPFKDRGRDAYELGASTSLSNLKSLYLDHTQITNVGLENMKKLSELWAYERITVRCVKTQRALYH
ncbi:MAG: protein phosphatase 1 regulatory subunit 42, partial [Anaerolineae bacterium]|nr:protein phosphatase 1 regulatory subunit 42 [Anaerolineae bacterium]